MPPKKEDDGDHVVTLSSGSEEEDGDSPAAAGKKKPAAAAAQRKKPAAAPAAAAGKRKPAPAKRSKDYSYDDDEETSSEPESDDYDSDKAPAARRRASKAKAPAKKKTKAASGSASPPPASAAKKSSPSKKQHILRAEPGSEPTEREYERATGYWLDPSLPLMWTAVSAMGEVGQHVRVPPRDKVAAIDLDGTLVNVKGSGPAGRSFPMDEDDWVFFNDHVPAQVRKWFHDGYEVAIISNQGGVQKKLAGKMAQLVKARAASVAATLGVPCHVLMCPSRESDNPYRKPQTGMWTFFEKELRPKDAPKIDRKASFYVGDAAGRSEDHNGKGADTDRRFADSLGLPFKTPEEAFGAQKGKNPISAEKWKAGVEAVKAAKEGHDDVAGPNAAILAALSGLADKIFALLKEKPSCLPGEDPTKWRFKATAYQNAARSIAGGFTEKITLKNLSAVGKLPKVGKSTLEKLKECLEKGRIALMDELEGYEAAGAAPAAAVPAHVREAQAAAGAFM